MGWNLSTENEISYCAQNVVGVGKLMGNDDCLYLNVVTPILELDSSKMNIENFESFSYIFSHSYRHLGGIQKLRHAILKTFFTPPFLRHRSIHKT